MLQPSCACWLVKTLVQCTGIDIISQKLLVLADICQHNTFNRALWEHPNSREMAHLVFSWVGSTTCCIPDRDYGSFLQLMSIFWQKYGSCSPCVWVGYSVFLIRWVIFWIIVFYYWNYVILNVMWKFCILVNLLFSAISSTHRLLLVMNGSRCTPREGQRTSEGQK
jgi:hypothetical protein